MNLVGGLRKNIGDYDLHDYTRYDIKQSNNDNIDFID